MAWTTKVTPNNGWDAGARTVAYLMADGLFEFEVGQAVGIVCGLNDVDNDAGYLELDHALLLESGKVTVIEGGIKKGSSISYAAGATFGISRVEGVVQYYVAGSLFYTSVTASTGAVFLDCSLYAPGDSVLDARITDYLSGSINLSNLSAFGTDQAGDYGLVVLSGLTTSNEDIPDPIELSPLAAVGTDGNFGFISLSPLTILNDVLIPESDYGYLTLSPLQLQEAADVVGEGIVSLLPMDCFGTDTDGIGFVEFEPLNIEATTSLVNVFIIDIPYFTGYSLYNDVILTIPAPEIDITGTVHSSAISAVIPAPTLTMYGGATTSFEIPALELTAAGAVQNLARVEFEIPAPELTATGLTGLMASFAATIPAPEIRLFGGATALFEIPALELTAAGTVNALATVAFEIPALELAATGTVGSVATISVEIPALELYVGLGNRVEFEIPALVLSAVASPANTVDETTYAINLTTGAVTQLLLGGFDKLVTAHGRLYGLKNGALTRLEGDVDGTVTTIPATIRFAPQTFGTNAVKRMSDVYWLTREADGITMDLIADERTLWRYQTLTDTAPAYGTHKIKTGRGVSFHTAGLAVRNRDGGALDIGGVELLVSPLSRKPK